MAREMTEVIRFASCPLILVIVRHALLPDGHWPEHKSQNARSQESLYSRQRKSRVRLTWSSEGTPSWFFKSAQRLNRTVSRNLVGGESRSREAECSPSTEWRSYFLSPILTKQSNGVESSCARPSVTRDDSRNARVGRVYNRLRIMLRVVVMRE